MAEINEKIRSRGWCFTMNNYTEDNLGHLKGEKITNVARYIVFGKEVAPSTGTKHIQGYIYFDDAKSMSATKKILGDSKVHISKANGTAEQNRKYCTKDGDYFEHGLKPEQGKRTDLTTLRDVIMKGEKTVDQIATEDPMAYHQYGRTMEKLEDIAQRSKFRTEMTECKWITGKTGSGKSHEAFKEYNPSTTYVLNTEDKGWWDGYNGQKTVIINDFKGEIRYGQLLQLIDKWPYSVPRRNRAPFPFTSKNIIITSIFNPAEVYHNLHKGDGIDQLMRRIHVHTIES